MERATPRVDVVSDAAFAATAAERIAAALREALDENATVTLALAGGETPRPVYAELARIPELPWERVAIYQGDERCVPKGDAASNFAMIQAALLDHVPRSPGWIFRMQGELDNRDAAASAYAEVVPDAFDVLVLGLGEDGHTASLFPFEPAVSEPRRRVVPTRSPKPPHDRLTITTPVLQAAKHTIVLVRGAAKREAFHRAVAGPWKPMETPAQLVRGATWIVDQAAAERWREGTADRGDA